MPKSIASHQQSAKTSRRTSRNGISCRLSGRPAFVASSSERPSGIVSDWKSQRDSFQNDAKLLGRAFAFVYVGSIVDQAMSDPISDELRKELVSDLSSALDARQTAVDWGVAKAVTDTDPFAHAGYKLASRLLRTDQPLIESLARKLTSQGTIEGDALRKWLDANASPLNFDELETSTTY